MVSRAWLTMHMDDFRVRSVLAERRPSAAEALADPYLSLTSSDASEAAALLRQEVAKAVEFRAALRQRLDAELAAFVSDLDAL